MTIRELADRFGVSPRTIHCWRARGVIPAPLGTRRYARYGQVHIEAIQAWLAIRHHFVSGAAAVAYCRENGISLSEYLREREASVRDFGIGIA